MGVERGAERIYGFAADEMIGSNVSEIVPPDTLGQLAAGIAHDFNNLLAVILSYAGFVIEETADRPAVRADAEQVLTAAQRAARLTRQLLIFSRREESAGVLSPKASRDGELGFVQKPFTARALLAKVRAALGTAPPNPPPPNPPPPA
jgi:signal transduction histidine kinase